MRSSDGNYTCGIVDKSRVTLSQMMLPPVASLALELWKNACVSVPPQMQSDSSQLQARCDMANMAIGRNLEQKVTSRAARLRGDKTFCFPGIYLSRIWI